MRSPPTLRAIVVTHDSASVLPTCLRSLQPQVAGLGGELVVVDNASNDASVAIARRHGARVIESGRNLGFAAGCNLGAQGTTAELIVLVNPDSELDDGCLADLRAVQRTYPRTGPIGGRARLADGRYDRRAVMGWPRLRGAVSFALGLDAAFRGVRWIDPEHGPRSLPETGPATVAVEAVSGAVMAVPRELWSDLGGFDERYYLYGEDVDLCVRASRAGWQPTVAVAAGYTHAGGLATDGSHERRVLLHRGKVQLYRHHLGSWRAPLAVFALQVGALVRGMATVAGGTSWGRRGDPWMQLYRSRRSWRGGHTAVTAGVGR